MRKNECLFFALLFFIMMSSCERAEKTSMGTLTFKMPALSQKVSSAKLSGAEPTSLSDINCYGVMVSGPEDFLKKNLCFQSENVATTIFSVGLVRAGIPSGSEISIDVPAGNDRVIKLVGFKSQSGYCHDWMGGGSDIENYVSPGYILGKAEQLSLSPGEVREVPISMSFNTTKWFDKCIGPDFRDENDSSVPTKLTVVKPTFPESYFVMSSGSTCQEFELGLADSDGNPAYISGSQTYAVALQAGKSDGTSIVSTLGIYSTPGACAAAMTLSTLSTVTLSSSLSKTKVYVKGFPSGASHAQVMATATGLESASLVLQTQTESQSTFAIDLPSAMVPGGCYVGSVTKKLMTGSPSSGPFSLTLGSASLQAFSSPDCTNSANVGSTAGVFYFKISPGETGTQTLGVTGAGASPAYKSIKIAPGDIIPNSLRVFGYNTLPTSANCGTDNTIKIGVVNSSGSLVPVPFNSGLSIVLGFPVTATLKEVNCAGGAVASGVAVSIGVGETTKSFSLVGTGVPVSDGAITLIPTYTGARPIPASIWNFILN